MNYEDSEHQPLAVLEIISDEKQKIRTPFVMLNNNIKLSKSELTLTMLYLIKSFSELYAKQNKENVEQTEAEMVDRMAVSLADNDISKIRLARK